MATETTQVMSNWDMFLKTVNTLADSQGFYSRLKCGLEELSEEELESYKEKLNGLKEKFYTTVDVVLWLED